jgi:hypothetical protein
MNTEIYIAPTRQGTINISAASTTVTGNDSDFTSADIGKQLKIRTNDGYKVFGITAVASVVSITIDAVAGYSQDNCYYNTDYRLLDVSAEVNLPVTYSVFDITEPDKRGGTRSKTLLLPGTKKNNIIFNHIFEIDGDGTFNPNIKADCIIYQDTIEVFRGSFGMLQVNRVIDTINYECYLLGRVTNIYTALGDKTLKDLDLSAYDHDYTKAVQSASWTLDYNHGFIYPLIDYGETDSSAQTIWQVNQLYPAVYARTLIDKIFAIAGYTYNSNFFGSTLFKKLIVPFNAGSFRYSEAEVATRRFEAAIVSGTASVSTTPTADQYLTIPYNDISTAPDTDPSGQFNTSTHKWTVAKAGHYNLMLLTNIQAAFNNTSFTFTADFTSYVEMVIVRGGVTLPVNPSLQHNIATILHYNGTNTPFTASFNSVFANQFLLAGDVVYFRVHLLPSTSTTFGLTVDVLSSSYVYNDVVNENIAEGDRIIMKDAVPQNIRAADFLKSITNMFNLYIDEDNNIPNRLNIEPRNDFYAAGILKDWTKKWDSGQEVNIIPMGELTARNYLFTYRTDQDYWNDRYSKSYLQANHNEVYGEYWLPVDNDFLANTQTIDVIFAPTILSQYQPNSLVLSSIRFVDFQAGSASDKSSPKSSVIRILYYGGLKPGHWSHRSIATGTPSDTPETTYPYAGHFDDPASPTIDVNFGLPAELYYQGKGQAITDNNLYNTYYSSHFDEVTDRNSKVVEMYLHLSPADIQNLDFRNQIYIAGQYYRLIEISNYDLVLAGLTKCRFMKVKTGKQFVSGTHLLNGGHGGSIGSQRIPVVNYNNGGVISLISGKNNTKKDGGVVITGDLNGVTGKNVQIFGGNSNVVDANNVTLINTSGQTITKDGVTYIDGDQYVKASDRSGQVNLASGTAVVPYTGVSVTSIILIAFNGDGTLTGTLSVVAGADLFTISSTSAGDTAGVNWYVAKL